MSTQDEVGQATAKAEAAMQAFRERQNVELEKLRGELARLGYDVEGKRPKEIKEIIQRPPTMPEQP